MEILENQEQWLADYRSGFLAVYRQTGELDWRKYNLPKNKRAPSGEGIDLSTSRLVLISSAGAYLPESHQPFDAANPLGDYSIRLIPTSVKLACLAFSHGHYDHAAVEKDPQVLLPLGHLHDLVSEGVVGELAPWVVSFMGYQPDAVRLVGETIPLILKAIRPLKAQGALLIPA